MLMDGLRKLKLRFSFKLGKGKVFDPYYQKRTSANDDLLKKAMKKTDKQLSEMFKLEKLWKKHLKK